MLFPGSPSLLLWWVGLIWAMARLAAAGLEVGSRLFSVRGMSKEMRQRLVDPTPEAVAANRARYRRRWIELTIVVLLVLPAQMLASSGAPLWAPIPAVIGWGAVAIGGGYLLWRLHRFETEGRARWRQRLHAEGDANVAAVLRSSDIPGR